MSSCGPVPPSISLPYCFHLYFHFALSPASPAPRRERFVVSCCWAMEENYAHSQLSLPVITLCEVCGAVCVNVCGLRDTVIAWFRWTGRTIFLFDNVVSRLFSLFPLTNFNVYRDLLIGLKHNPPTPSCIPCFAS